MNTKYWTALSSIEQLDSNFIRRLYNYFGDIESAYNASPNDFKQIEGLNARKAEFFIEKRKTLDLNRTLDYVLDKGIKILTFDDENYPYMLRQIPDPPACLYYKGDLFGCNLEKTVAFVGSRRASFGGKDSVRKIISDFANTDICIVSGLAAGIDSVSHESALDNNLKTIGVIASGLNFTYPAANKHLYERIEEGGGAVITEYYPTFEPLKFRFPQRNRIVSGLSYGTVIVEAAIRSGALITANLTLEQGRELMCIPGPISSTNMEGIYKLLKDGASMVTSGDDIFNVLGWEVKKIINPSNSDKSAELDMNEKRLFDIISVEPKGFDELLVMSGLTADELLICLTGMELKGLIEQTAGDRYKKV